MCNDGNVDTSVMAELQEKYLRMYPVEDINFGKFFPCDLSYTCCCEQQAELLQATIASDVAKRFPPKLSYTKSFLKLLIQQIEQQGHEVLQEIYTSYTDMLAGNGGAVQSVFGGAFGETTEEDSFYRTYSPWQGARITLRETSNVVAGGTTGLRTWQAAHVLLQHLLDTPSIIEGQSVVELGAGIGLLGLGAVLRGLPLRYTFTDEHPAVMASLTHNLALNLGGAGAQVQHGMCEWRHGDCIVRLAELDWHCRGSARRLADCDVVLAADVVFDPRLFSALLNTLSALLQPTEASAEVSRTPEANAGCPASPQGASQRFALLAVTLRNQKNYEQFLSSVPEHGLQVVSVEDRIYREAPSRPQQPVKLLRLVPTSIAFCPS